MVTKILTNGRIRPFIVESISVSDDVDANLPGECVEERINSRFS